MKKTVFALLAMISFACSDDSGHAHKLTDGALITAGNSFDIINDLDFQLAQESAADNDGMRPTAQFVRPSCAVVDVASGPDAGFPLVITIDFGDGCTHNGITRAGVITFTLSGPLMQAGSELTITRSNYSISNYQVAGTVHYVNTTVDAAMLQWTRTINNGQVVHPAGYTYNHSGTRSVRMTQGSSTPLSPTDNVYEVMSGNHIVTRQGGSSVTMTVVSPLIKKATCLYVSQGSLMLDGDFLDGVLDFGDNTCDNQAVYTHSDGTAHNITL